MAYALDRSRDAIFVARLHAKTMARRLPWVRAEHEGRYQVRVGDFLVEIADGAAANQDPEILICDAAGQAIEILTADLLVEANAQIGDARRMAFVETYEAARRIALGVDRMIDDLIVALV